MKYKYFSKTDLLASLNIVARVDNPIRNLDLFLKNRQKEYKNYAKQAKDLQSRIDKLKSYEDGDLLEYFLMDCGFDSKYSSDSWDNVLERFLKYQDDLNIDIRNLLDVLKKDDRHYIQVFWKYLVTFLEENYSGIEILFEQIDVLLEELPKDKNRIKETAKDYIEGDSDTKPFCDKVVKVIFDIKEFSEAIKKSIINLKKKIMTHSKYIKLEHEEKPESEDIEELYHATMYTKEILKKGFSKVKPKTALGVGGATEGISLSSDKKICFDIARCFKELIMLARGEISYLNVIDWMKREGIDPKKCNYSGRESEPETLGDVYRLYRCYIGLSKIRTDPVFWLMIDDNKFMLEMAKRKVSDVGVLKCKVNVDHPDVKYVKGEMEYRVPPEAILDVKLLGK